MTVNADMTIMEILEFDPAVAAVFMQNGMHCIHCEAASGETLREAGYVHGMDDAKIEELTAQLNDFLSGAPQEG